MVSKQSYSDRYIFSLCLTALAILLVFVVWRAECVAEAESGNCAPVRAQEDARIRRSRLERGLGNADPPLERHAGQSSTSHCHVASAGRRRQWWCRMVLVEFNVPLYTLQVISEAGAVNSDVHLPFSNGGPAT